MKANKSRKNDDNVKESGDLAEGLGVGAHVSHDDEDVLLTLVREELGRRQRDARRDDALYAAPCARTQRINNYIVMMRSMLHDAHAPNKLI